MLVLILNVSSSPQGPSVLLHYSLHAVPDVADMPSALQLREIVLRPELHSLPYLIEVLRAELVLQPGLHVSKDRFDRHAVSRLWWPGEQLNGTVIFSHISTSV